MSNDPNEQATDEPQSGGGPVDRPDGSIDDDSVHPLTNPDDPPTGNVADPVVPLGNAPTNTGEDVGQDARLMGPAGN